MPVLTESTAAAAENIKERLTPALETLDEAVRRGRRAAVRGQQAAIDARDAAALRIRRYPLAAVTLASIGAAVAGCIIGFGVGRMTRCDEES